MNFALNLFRKLYPVLETSHGGHMSQYSTIISKLRADLPKEAFEPQPFLGTLVLAATLTLIVGGTWILAIYSPPWYVCALLSVVIGAAYGTLAFLSHEVSHGSVYRHKVLKDSVTSLGFLIFGFTARLWMVWHNKIHHTQANLPDLDPDSYEIGRAHV